MEGQVINSHSLEGARTRGIPSPFASLGERSRDKRPSRKSQANSELYFLNRCILETVKAASGFYTRLEETPNQTDSTPRSTLRGRQR